METQFLDIVPVSTILLKRQKNESGKVVKELAVVMVSKQSKEVREYIGSQGKKWFSVRFYDTLIFVFQVINIHINHFFCLI